MIYSLVIDGNFDDYIIEHVGAVNYDHHLVLVGLPNASGDQGQGLDDRLAWLRKTVVIDVWKGNLNNNSDYVTLASLNKYVTSQLRFFCAYSPKTRGADREFANRLTDPIRTATAGAADRLARAKKETQEELVVRPPYNGPKFERIVLRDE